MQKPVKAMNAVVLGCLLALWTTAAFGQVKPRLSLQGSPYFGGDMAFTLSEPSSGGQFAWAALGLDPVPLHALVPTAIGPWAIGTLLRVIPGGFVPANGRLDVLFNVGPVIPSAIGVHLVVQGYVLDRLSNPASVPLDLPYYVAQEAQVITAPVPTQGEFFGDRVAFADLNADGEQDLIVGCWFADVGGLQNSGRAYVFWGPDFASSVALQPPTPINGGYFAGELGVGDIDGDGIVDLILGESPGEPIQPAASAHLYVYWGDRGFSSMAPPWSVPSLGTGQAYSSFGRRLAVDDFNDDGFDDVAVGRTGATINGHANAGAIDVHWGPSLLAGMTLTHPVPAVDEFFGSRILAADVSGDGTADLVVGNNREDAAGIASVGRIHLFSGPSLTHWQSIENPLPAGADSRFANSLSVGDLQGDGFIDVVTSDEKDHAFIFWAPGFTTYTVVDRPPSVFAQGEDSLSYGYSTGVADVNGDGWSDVAVSDPFSGPIGACSGVGAVFVALGPYFATHALLFDTTNACPNDFGWSLDLADLNSDGRHELAVGNDITNGVPGGEVCIFGP